MKVVTRDSITDVILDPRSVDWDALEDPEKFADEVSEFLLEKCDGKDGHPTYEQGWAFISDVALFAPSLFAPYIALTTHMKEGGAENWYEKHERPLGHLYAEVGDNAMIQRERMARCNKNLIHYLKLGATLDNEGKRREGERVDDYREECLVDYKIRHAAHVRE